MNEEVKENVYYILLCIYLYLFIYLFIINIIHYGRRTRNRIKGSSKKWKISPKNAKKLNNTKHKDMKN